MGKEMPENTENTIVNTLSKNWLFHLGELPESWQKSCDESKFSPVSVPHDWSVHYPFSRENSSGTGYVCGGIGWYRTRFRLPEKSRGRRLRLSFDGVYKHSEVWVNGYYKGFHANGYTPFAYDITDDVCFGNADNVIAVRVDHRDIADSRWFTGSGLLRRVRLIEEAPVHCEEYGLSFTVLHADAACAELGFLSRVVNDSPAPAEVAARWQLSCEDSTPTLEVSSTVAELKPGEHASLSAEAVPLAAPRLWSPETPQLYLLRTFLSVNGGPEYLADEQRVGIRSFAFHPDYGFSLNGINMKLRGVCLHDDCGALGSASAKEIWYRRLTKLRAAGCNAVRMSHNPHMDELYDLCDELGFLVIDEAFDEWEGPKNKWSTGHNVYPPRHEGYYHDFPACHEEDLRAMTRRAGHHPCVILWSIGNEIDYPNDPYCHPLFTEMTGNNDADKPAAERMYSPDRPNAERLAPLAAMLAGEVRRMDPSRPVTLAAAFPELSARLGFLDALDVAGYNYKEQLYEESHARFPSLPFLGSENGHDWEAWKVVRDREYICGQFLWTGIDYLGEARGWPIRASGAGLMTLAGYEKTGYYRRRSFWSAEPMAHLATARLRHDSGVRPDFFSESWNYCPGEDVRVFVYTNLSRAELFLDGALIAAGERSDDEDSISFILPFAPGTLSVRAFGLLTTLPPAVRGTKEYEVFDSLRTASLPTRLRLERFEVPAESCSDPDAPIEQIEISVCDSEGSLILSGAYPISVEVQGGTLLGLENGDIADVTDYTGPVRASFHGRLIAYVRRSSPQRPLHITARCDELAGAELVIGEECRAFT
ncbi:sugar-binding domain-containing protein [Lachnoclostridium sp. Marseille-P6806]|uniref:sugar-binding domain-containing protein n=1 Tax=Lachnoclostridium sp. Marseille-P6806 TaxID=2364793 RepID=UPI0013EF107A|nr:sugar-binding domain-containing protein [Lachnoclostridium sp. Marseille-P6806]